MIQYTNWTYSLKSDYVFHQVVAEVEHKDTFAMTK